MGGKPRLRREVALCECGNPREVAINQSLALHGCESCNRMDGFGPRQREIVMLLREAEGPLKTSAIAAELRVKHNTAAVALSRAVRAGVVTRRLGDQRHSEESEYYLPNLPPASLDAPLDVACSRGPR
jgi:hypothetical protein